jgi:hypothetical protein
LFDTFEETRSLSQDEKDLRQQAYDRLSIELRQRAAYWKQRAKFRAVREDDSNTAFFHTHATARLRKNSIRSISVDGIQVTSHQAKVQGLTEYFKSIIGVQGHSEWEFDCEALYWNMAKATDELTSAFTEHEALAAIKSMNRCSAPGPDGFGQVFTRLPGQRWDLMS